MVNDRYGYPFFSSIKNAEEVKDLVLNLTGQRRLLGNQ